MDTQIRGYGTAQEWAHDHVKEAILTGTYRAGARIDPDLVARQLGMSRMPVREALRHLEAEGLVVIRPNRGAVVTVLGPEDMLEIFEMRAVLEGLAASLATAHLDEDSLEDLTILAARMDRSRGNVDQWLRLHNEFHDAIGRRSGRPRLATQLALLRRAVEPYLRAHGGTQGSVARWGGEHQTLLEALRSRNAARAEQTAREHVHEAAAYMVETLRAAGRED